MKIGDFGMSRQIVMRQSGEECCLERALSANVIGTAAYSAPELLLAESPVKKNRVDAATVLKSDVSFLCRTRSAAGCCRVASGQPRGKRLSVTLQGLRNDASSLKL